MNLELFGNFGWSMLTLRSEKDKLPEATAAEIEALPLETLVLQAKRSAKSAERGAPRRFVQRTTRKQCTIIRYPALLSIQY